MRRTVEISSVACRKAGAARRIKERARTAPDGPLPRPRPICRTAFSTRDGSDASSSAGRRLPIVQHETEPLRREPSRIQTVRNAQGEVGNRHLGSARVRSGSARITRVTLLRQRR